MKNLFKKIGALLVAAVMVLSMCTAAFADAGNDGIIGTADDTGKITVENVDEENGVSVSAYPIALAKYENNTFIGYEKKVSTGFDLESPKEDQLKAIFEEVKNNNNWLPLIKDTDVKTTWSRENCQVGMYLVKVSGSESYSYNLAVVSVSYTNKDGNSYKIEDGKTDMELKNGVTKVKKSSAPTVDKQIKVSDTTTTKGNTVNIGDKVPYVVTINPIPYYAGKHPVLNVEDILSAGLTLDKASVKVQIKDGNTVSDLDSAKYDIVKEDNKLAVNFVKTDVAGNKNYTLNEFEGKEVVITYEATVNNNAALNEKDNNNNVTLNYTKDSKVDNQNGTDTDKTYTYTFELDGSIEGQISTEDIIKKTGVEKGQTTSSPLAGAKFTLYTKKDCTTQDKYVNPKVVNPATSDTKGQLTFTGLAAGEYYLKETEAPSGYALNTNVFKVVISANLDATTGKLKSWTVAVSDANATDDAANSTTFNVTNEGVASIAGEKANTTEIKNTQLSTLPSTGGMGTYLFTIIGVVVMAGAAGVFFISRRKGSEE